MTTGFNESVSGLWIAHDVQAQLTYTFDWEQWLPEGDSIASVQYSVAARVNDPTPVTIVSSGVTSNRYTYVELTGGQVGKTYIVTAKVTTSDGLIDRRSFRVKIENRSA